MSRYLLDTNFALVGLAEPQRIPASLRAAVDTGAVFLSVLSYWEVLLKSMKGKLVVGDPRLWWSDALDRLAATPLPLRPDHVDAIRDLPAIHQDPFDRALIAQATVEGLTLATLDRDIPKYASERFKVP
ncbi:MAG: type II toxin-antitoxin system VapC family toxin [Acidobacteriia bacterium]|nr:type II toxin-antitoxin system VapC family toxin [Terriglobia bacterium]